MSLPKMANVFELPGAEQLYDLGDAVELGAVSSTISYVHASIALRFGEFTVADLMSPNGRKPDFTPEEIIAFGAHEIAVDVAGVTPGIDRDTNPELTRAYIDSRMAQSNAYPYGVDLQTDQFDELGLVGGLTQQAKDLAGATLFFARAFPLKEKLEQLNLAARNGDV